MSWISFIAQDEKGFKCLLPRVEGVLETRSVQNKWDIRLRVVLNKVREIEDHAALSESVGHSTTSYPSKDNPRDANGSQGTSSSR